MTSAQGESSVVVTDIPSDAPANPALQTGGYVAAATLLINGVTLFVVPLSTDQRIYLISMITAIAPFLAGVLIRFKVFSPKSVEQIKIGYELVLRERDHLVSQLRATGSVADALREVLPALSPPTDTRMGSVEAVSATQPAPPPSPMPSPAPSAPGPDQGQFPPGYAPTAQPAGSYQYTPQEIAPAYPSGYRRHRVSD